MVQTGWRQVSGRAEHIRSHQLDHDPQLILSTDLSPTDRHKLLGNQLADEMATSAQEHHDEYHQEQFMIDKMAYKVAQAVVELAAQLMPLHPRRGRHARALPPPIPPIALDDDEPHPPGLPTAPSAPIQNHKDSRDRHHEWTEVRNTPGSWRCKACGLVANTGQPEPPKATACTGESKAISTVGKGHRLVKYRPHPEANTPMTGYACLNCHRTATSKPVFTLSCDDLKTASRTQAYRRMEKGLHPHPRWGTTPLFAEGDFFFLPTNAEQEHW